MFDRLYRLLATKRRVIRTEIAGDADHREDKDAGPFRISPLDMAPERRLDTVAALADLADQTMLDPERFFALSAPPTAPGWSASSVSFISDGQRPDVVTAEIHGRLDADSAAILVPHWNAQPGDYRTLAHLLGLMGTTTFVLTLPFHGSRGAGGQVANEFLNADLGASINSVRQAVIDVRGLTQLLRQRGFRSISYIGVSLGSCIAALAATFEPGIDNVSLLLTAGDFADTVWTGTATRHIRKALDGHVSFSDLQRAWKIISPSSFLPILASRRTPILMILGEYDRVVPFRLGQDFAKLVGRYMNNVEILCLPCGHYSLKLFPFGAAAFLRVARFIRRHSRAARVAELRPTSTQQTL